ncbi:MAG: hypothetical protein GEU94_10110 [Micromonosporaceae bacterium]|nr:hypothetical protein [Micromonosporaceae bacterium]
MIRVFHVPAHLEYVQKLVGGGFAPVSSPDGRGALRVSDLLTIGSWGWFDVLHLHTVELATRDELVALAARCREERKRFVVTVHDLTPNIEPDRGQHIAKLRVVLDAADAAATLTSTAWAALRDVTARPCMVVPHGAAFPLDLLHGEPVGAGHGVAVYGALRPNRDYTRLLAAWRQFPRRMPLRLLVRSVSPDDERRYARTLAELRHAAEHGVEVQITGRFVPPAELLAWLRRSHLLALPYCQVTHSGQLEAARDAGLGVLAPDVATLRDQLSPLDWPVTWFPPLAPLTDWLARAVEMPAPAETAVRAAERSRHDEHRAIIDAHATMYGAPATNQPGNLR